MIERYTRSAMGKIWQEESKYSRWLEIETLAAEGMAEYGIIPVEAAREIREKGDFEIARILEIEESTHHDVIAFLTNVSEYVGESSRYVHLGMTSSDILDTALAMAMKESGELLLAEVDRFIGILLRRAEEFRKTPCIGRSHGIHAEPMSFGLKLLLWYAEMRRNRLRLERAIESVATGQISGAVGTLAHMDPRVEEFVCRKLGLSVASVSTQVLQRDRHAEFMTTLALIASSLDKVATELRNLQRTDILEVEEAFARGQKGSSAMPHKRNPITGERVSGLARVLRANAIAALENVALWHERDITHSSVERVIIPDSCILLDYMLDKISGVVENLQVYPENMLKNLYATRGLVFSQSLLLALVMKGLSREDAYALVQKAAMGIWNSDQQFQDAVLESVDIRAQLDENEILECFDLERQLRNVDAIYERTLESSMKGAPS
ncbi:MAG: adenylosuccinate lyase [Candidatus Krumholzibacteria bacterium]|nr:adenylosuccinate lyase [Candidatus Krumholzibacteria bacterium]MDP7021243.1 adenylosuccinate lyase [Candidatus Krumholzibacteria bacterium]